MKLYQRSILAYSIQIQILLFDIDTGLIIRLLKALCTINHSIFRVLLT